MPLTYLQTANGSILKAHISLDAQGDCLHHKFKTEFAEKPLGSVLVVADLTKGYRWGFINPPVNWFCLRVGLAASMENKSCEN